MRKGSMSVPLPCRNPTGSESEDESPPEISACGFIGRRIMWVFHIYVSVSILILCIYLCVCIYLCTYLFGKIVPFTLNNY